MNNSFNNGFTFSASTGGILRHGPHQCAGNRVPQRYGTGHASFD